MENGPFVDGLPFSKMVDLSMAMLNNQRVCMYVCIYIYLPLLKWPGLKMVPKHPQKSISPQLQGACHRFPERAARRGGRSDPSPVRVVTT